MTEQVIPDPVVAALRDCIRRRDQASVLSEAAHRVFGGTSKEAAPYKEQDAFHGSHLRGFRQALDLVYSPRVVFDLVVQHGLDQDDFDARVVGMVEVFRAGGRPTSIDPIGGDDD